MTSQQARVKGLLFMIITMLAGFQATFSHAEST
jgi:hypothetical protein